MRPVALIERLVHRSEIFWIDGQRHGGRRRLCTMRRDARGISIVAAGPSQTLSLRAPTIRSSALAQDSPVDSLLSAVPQGHRDRYSSTQRNRSTHMPDSCPRSDGISVRVALETLSVIRRNSYLDPAHRGGEVLAEGLQWHVHPDTSMPCMSGGVHPIAYDCATDRGLRAFDAGIQGEVTGCAALRPSSVRSSGRLHNASPTGKARIPSMNNGCSPPYSRTQDASG